MIKRELVEELAKKTKMKKTEVEKVLNAFIETTEECIGRNEELVIIGFGKFYVKEQKERKGRNPKTGEEIDIPAKRKAAFKAGIALNDKANS